MGLDPRATWRSIVDVLSRRRIIELGCGPGNSASAIGRLEGKTAVVTGGTPRQRLEVIEAIHLPGKPLRGANAGFGGARIPLET